MDHELRNFYGFVAKREASVCQGRLEHDPIVSGILPQG